MKKNQKNKIISASFIFIAVAIIAYGLFATFKYYRSLSNDDINEDVIEMADVINRWIGKKLELPLGIGRFITKCDSTSAHFPTEKFKILRYVGKGGCSSCRLHLNVYPKLLSELFVATGHQVGFVCIINPTNMDEIRRILRRDNYAELTMWIDETDTINSLNQFPEIESLQTFLLDKDNKVLAIGDPAVNPRVMRLYTQILSNDTINPVRLPYTILSVENDEIQIGKVAAGDIIHIPVRVKNVGHNEFILDKVITSCDCTTAELSSECIAPGESAMLTIHFREPDAIGDFYRVVNIFGNTEQELSIEFYGTVK